MIFDTLDTFYAYATSGTYGNYIELTDDLVAINVVNGQIPVRPLQGATGNFCNDSVQRIEMVFEKEDFDDLSGMLVGDTIKVKLDNGAIVSEQYFDISAITFTKFNGSTEHAMISLTPTLGSTVALSLHAE